LDYLIDRNQRDVVHGKAGTSEKPKEDKDKKEKKPFEDRVLNKALDYLRGEIRRVEARPAAGPPETAHG
jgi:hypothetical protein